MEGDPQDALFIQAVASTENDLALQEEIAKLSVDGASLDPEMVRTSQPDAHTDSETEYVQENKKQVIEEQKVYGLYDILFNAGLLNFKPGKEDGEVDMLRRIRKMCPSMAIFGATVRLAEGILTPAALRGAKCIRRNNAVEHMIAKARAEFHCCASRQTRHGLWQQYTERIVEKLNDDKVETWGRGAMKPVNFRPCSFFKDAKDDDEKQVRDFQVLVVQPFLAPVARRQGKGPVCLANAQAKCKLCNKDPGKAAHACEASGR